MTDPYGKLEYAVGDEDDFWCFDFELKDNSIVLHATINSETGHFIEDAYHEEIPLIQYDYQDRSLVEQALDWCAWNNVEHDTKGWNQDPFYFHRAVMYALDCQIAPDEECKPEIPERIKR